MYSKTPSILFYRLGTTPQYTVYVSNIHDGRSGLGYNYSLFEIYLVFFYENVLIIIARLGKNGISKADYGRAEGNQDIRPHLK